MTAVAGPPLVSLQAITRRFGDVLANDRVDFDLYPGEVHALIGENGAGKTTLMKVLAGFLSADAGRVFLRGQVQRRWDPARARRGGVGMVHQHLRLIHNLTVLENLLLATRGPGLWLDVRAARGRLVALAERFGFSLNFDDRVGGLDGPRRQWVAIARLLAADAHILILDEPTAFIGPRETDRLLAFLRHQAGQGQAVAFISHKLPEVLAVADRITVLRRGRVVGSFLREEAAERDLARLMVGERPDIGDAQAEAGDARPPGEDAPLLTLRGVALPGGRLQDVNVTVRAGEVLGIGGVAGNGQQELADLLLGLGPNYAGEITLIGHRCRGRLPRGLLRQVMAHIPGEVVNRGLVGTMTVEENCLLGHHRRPPVARMGCLSGSALRSLAEGVLSAARLTVPLKGPIGSLSGGMQQRLAVARALAKSHRILLAEQPTAGLDVAAAAWVRAAVRQEAAKGRAVLLISYDLDELLAVSDRVAVLYDGRLLGPYPRTELSPARLADLMSGVGVAHETG